MMSETSLNPRLQKLLIKNFRCIGEKPVEIELDDIVVLVGSNNVGKSSILKAYELIMCEGSKNCELKIEDFPNKNICSDKYPEIELHTIVYDNSPGDKWIQVLDNGEKSVKEKWVWKTPGKPVRYGFNAEKNEWASDTDREKVPWGAANVANSRRPQPHMVDAFDPPETQSQEIISLLMSILTDRVANLKEDKDDKSAFQQLLSNVKEIQKNIVEESQKQINKIQEDLSQYIGKIFPKYEVQFDARPEDDVEKAISFFKSNPQLLIGPQGGFKCSVDRQGSGARRTLLWTALKIISENSSPKKSENRPHVLLIDEPEICLHPSATREACDLLYNLPVKDNWQVIVTTHSPQFIDISRDNTTIVRVERDELGDIFGTTLFRPERAKLTTDDKENLKFLNLFDPYVAEFFFGGKTILVEGDTEYTAFNHVIAENPDKYKNIHVIRARGKATIVSLVKILNQFGTEYAVLHDSDTPKAMRKNKAGVKQEIVNPAWTKNKDILAEVAKSTRKTRLVASVPNFEGAYYNAELKNEKPYAALSKLRENPIIFEKVEKLLDGLLNFEKELPDMAIEWNNIQNLEDKLKSI